MDQPKIVNFAVQASFERIEALLIMPRIPMTEIPKDLNDKILSLGGKPLHLYRILTHHPDLFSAWLDFAYSLRSKCSTPRTLRELMILRGAQVCQSDYEWQQHLQMAVKAGVPQTQIEALATWNSSPLFSEQEKCSLEFMEAVVAGDISMEVTERMLMHFSYSEYLELLLTASFYVMVPRVLKGLDVPLEK